MPEENPFDQTMREMKKVLKQIEENSDKVFDMPLNDALSKKIDAWEKSVNTLITEMKETVKNTGIPPQLIKEIKEEIPEGLTPDERETLRRVKQFKEEVKALQGKLKTAEEESAPEEPTTESKTSPRKGKRKNKFKKMGGDDWKPI